jgi:hypothetical protein
MLTLSDELLEEFGFEKSTPTEGPEKTMWENKKWDVTFFHRPTASDVMQACHQAGFFAGNEALRDQIKQLLNIKT